MNRESNILLGSMIGGLGWISLKEESRSLSYFQEVAGNQYQGPMNYDSTQYTQKIKGLVSCHPSFLQLPEQITPEEQKQFLDQTQLTDRSLSHHLLGHLLSRVWMKKVLTPQDSDSSRFSEEFQVTTKTWKDSYWGLKTQINLENKLTH